LIYGAVAAVLWGGLYVVSQVAFTDLPPGVLSLIRLAIGVIALALVLRRMPARRERRLLLLGLLVAITVLVQAWGTYLSGAALGSLLTLMTPPFVALLAPVFLSERTSLIRWLGILVGVAGAAIVIGPARSGSLVGDLLLVSASLSWAAFTVLGAGLVRAGGALEVTTAASALALPWVAAAALVEAVLQIPVHFTTSSVLALVYLGLGATALGWWAWYRGVETAPAAVAAVPFLLQPVVGVGLSILVFGLALSPAFLAGSLLVGVGMLVASRG
jgi:drug/metabolite transporter (DMT)-like permease